MLLVIYKLAHTNRFKTFQPVEFAGIFTNEKHFQRFLLVEETRGNRLVGTPTIKLTNLAVTDKR